MAAAFHEICQSAIRTSGNHFILVDGSDGNVIRSTGRHPPTITTSDDDDHVFNCHLSPYRDTDSTFQWDIQFCIRWLHQPAAALWLREDWIPWRHDCWQWLQYYREGAAEGRERRSSITKSGVSHANVGATIHREICHGKSICHIFHLLLIIIGSTWGPQSGRILGSCWIASRRDWKRCRTGRWWWWGIEFSNSGPDSISNRRYSTVPPPPWMTGIIAKNNSCRQSIAPGHRRRPLPWPP